MNAKERYFWDLNGHLILRGVLNKKELAAANAAIDACADRISPGEPNCLSRGSESLQGLGRPGLRGTQLLNIEKPHCDIFKKMLVHPDVISRLRYMCGRGFRLDHGPQFIGGVKGTSGHRLHGAGAPHKPFVGYHHQDGEPHVGGVTVSWQLTEVIEGKGGFACVPGSHKSNFDAPDGVTSCDDHMGTVIQPGAQPGDVVFFMDGAQTHGALPWKASHPRRTVLFKFHCRTSVFAPAAVSCVSAKVFAPQTTSSQYLPVEIISLCTSKATAKTVVDVLCSPSLVGWEPGSPHQVGGATLGSSPIKEAPTA